MENLAHSLTAVAIARTGMGKKVPFGTIFLVVAANLPDLDVVATFGGPLHYLHYHRGITHSIVGAMIMGFVLTGLLWLFRRHSKQKPDRFLSALGVVTLVSLTHPLLDLTNSYGLRPYLPFSDIRFFGDLVFIVDPYLWIILGSAIFLTATRTRLSLSFWVLGIALISLILFFFSLNEPKGFVAFSVMGLSVLTVFLMKRHRLVWGPHLATASLAVVVGYWGFLWICQAAALENGIEARNERYPEVRGEVSALPRPIDPFSWDILFQDENKVYYGLASSLEQRRIPFQEFPRNLHRPEVQAALESCPGTIFSYFDRFDFATVEDSPTGSTVTLRDARFSRQQVSGFGSLQLKLSPTLQVSDEIACPEVDTSYLRLENQRRKLNR